MIRKTTTFFLPTGGYGRIGSFNANWATLKGLTTATAAANGLSNFIVSNDSGTYYLNRLFLPFNTVSIKNGSVIISATLSLYRDDAVSVFIDTDVGTFHIVPSTQTDPTTIANADFDNLTLSSKGSVLASTTSNGAYFNFTVSDLTLIVPGSYSKFACVNDKDLNNTTPNNNTGLYIGIQNAAAANPPKLVVTYDEPANSISYFM